MRKQMVRMTQKVMQTMIEYFGADRQSAYHALKVSSFCRIIAIGEGLESERVEVLECAGALHDIGKAESIREYGNATAEYHEIMGGRVARELLEGLGCPWDFVEQVLFLITHHHHYGMDGGISLQILIEANLLVLLDGGEPLSPTPDMIKAEYIKTKTGQELMNTMFLW